MALQHARDVARNKFKNGIYPQITLADGVKQALNIVTELQLAAELTREPKHRVSLHEKPEYDYSAGH